MRPSGTSRPSCTARTRVDASVGIVILRTLCKGGCVHRLRFMLPLLWTAVVLSLSSDEWSAARTGALLLPLLRRVLPWALPEQFEALHWLIRKTAHVVEYALLATFWRHTLARPGERPAWRAAFALTILTAAVDELLQSTTAGRGPSVVDVLLDASGAAAALALLGLGVARTADRVTSALLWIAAGGGSVLLLVAWAAGAPLGWFVWSVPAAWLLLLLWHRRRRAA